MSKRLTTGPVNGKYTHTFKSGGGMIPSLSIEYGNPDGPVFSTNYGAAVNQLKIGMARSGMLNASLSVIAQGESDPGTISIAGSPTALTGPRFAQATGSVTVDGTAAADILSADLGYTNNLEKLEVIRADGRIGGFDPGVCRASGSITTRFATLALYNKARSKLPVALSFGWATDIASLVFTLPRVFLPKPKRSVSGPKGKLLGSATALADVLGIQPRSLRAKTDADRGVSCEELETVAAALDARAAEMIQHAAKLRAEAVA